MSEEQAMFLSREELKALTRRIQYAAQLRVLRSMGIEHRVRPDGSLAVLRTHIEQVFGGYTAIRKLKQTEPNWGAINASRT